MTTRIISLVILLCACGSSLSNGGSFTTQAVRAEWTGGGEFLTLRFAPVDMAARGLSLRGAFSIPICKKP